MKHSMKYLLICLFSVMFLAACNSSPVKSEGNNITSMSITRGGIPGPWRKASTFLSVNKDLSFEYIKKNRTGGVAKKVKKKISQAQFDNIMASLKEVNLDKLKGKVLEHGVLGGSNSSISIGTDQQTYSYSNGYKIRAPKAVAQAMAKLWKLAP